MVDEEQNLYEIVLYEKLLFFCYNYGLIKNRVGAYICLLSNYLEVMSSLKDFEFHARNATE